MLKTYKYIFAFLAFLRPEMAHVVKIIPSGRKKHHS